MSIPEAHFSPLLGDQCQMRSQGDFPVWAVTTLDHTQILFSNVASGPNRWVLTGGTVYTQRFWASSTATLHLSVNTPSVYDLPPGLPIYRKVVDGQERTLQLQPEDEICVWMGYIPVMRPVTPEDFEESRLLRNYVGVVDTISTVSTPRGISLTIQCRDRVRYLQDTEVTFDPSYSQDASILAQAFAKGSEHVLRSDLILKISQLGIGYVAVNGSTPDCNLNGRIIAPHFIQDLGFFANYQRGPGGSVGNYATVGEGALVGIAGSTGSSTGPHIHVEYTRAFDPAKRRPSSEHLNRLALNGIPFSQLQITSEHRCCNPRRPGHNGIDLASKIGDRVTATVPVSRVQGPLYEHGGAGYYTIVYFPDGVQMQVFHQDPSVQNAALGSGGATLNTAAASPTPQAENADGSSSGNANLRAVLDMIAWAEGTSIIAGSDNGYNVMVGGRLFNSYADHPRVLAAANSTAAGRYQFLDTTWDETRNKLGLPDFSPESQDKGAIYRLRYRGAYEDVINGNWPAMLDKISREWASLPTSAGTFRYPGQGTKTPQQVYTYLENHLKGINPTGTAVSADGGAAGPGGAGGFVFDDGPLEERTKPIDFFYVCKNEFSPVIPCRARTRNPKELLDLKSEIGFNIITGRLPFSVDVISKDFTIETQVPIEFIRFLSAQEPYPTEVFQNHLDGNFYYTPRVNDISGLADPKRFYRTYYIRSIPQEVSTKVVEPTTDSLFENLETDECSFIQQFPYDKIFSQVDYNQMAINFKDELSSLGLKTNFFIANQAPNGTVAGQALILHMSARPAFLRGHEIGGRNFYVVDETIKNIGEAAAVAAATARLYAKELRSASMSVLGDPSLTPGELLQVINSPIHVQPLQTYVDERQAVLEYESATRSSYLNALEVTRQGIESRAEEAAPLAGNYSSEPSPDQFETPESEYKMRTRKAEFKQSAEDIFCSVTQEETATVVQKDGEEWGENQWRKSGFSQEPRSIWRIEGVKHSLNSGGSQGWMTELALLSPY